MTIFHFSHITAHGCAIIIILEMGPTGTLRHPCPCQIGFFLCHRCSINHVALRQNKPFSNFLRDWAFGRIICRSTTVVTDNMRCSCNLLSIDFFFITNCFSTNSSVSIYNNVTTISSCFSKFSFNSYYFVFTLILCYSTQKGKNTQEQTPWLSDLLMGFSNLRNKQYNGVVICDHVNLSETIFAHRTSILQ